MERAKTIILCVLTLICIVRSASAWNGGGHMMIAAEAFRSLAPESQQRTTKLLMAHPDYPKWERDFAMKSNLQLPVYVFMRASTWPDEIRRKGNAYDHPQWHFIDYPLRPPLFPVEPGPSPDDDILYGIQQCEKTLSDTNASDQIRGIYLSWLIHLIGDLHQPLHCSSLVDSAYPSGDKGGNNFYVRPAERAIRLHSLWDGLLGTAEAPNQQLNYAIQNDQKFPRVALPELLSATGPKEWSLESRSVAIEKAYLHGELRGGTNLDTAVPLPTGYTKQAKAVAERQAALAGYRLADEINHCLK